MLTQESMQTVLGIYTKAHVCQTVTHVCMSLLQFPKCQTHCRSK